MKGEKKAQALQKRKKAFVSPQGKGRQKIPKKKLSKDDKKSSFWNIEERAIRGPNSNRSHESHLLERFEREAAWVEYNIFLETIFNYPGDGESLLKKRGGKADMEHTSVSEDRGTNHKGGAVKEYIALTSRTSDGRARRDKK